MTTKEDQEKNKKQGEEGKITKTSEGDNKDFKAPGIEGTKDAAPELREEIARLKAENAKLKAEKSPARPAGGKTKEAVTIEDVLPALRKKGYKI